MAKARSPQYPAIGLKEAVEKVTAIYGRDYQNPIPRAVVAEHMGYQSLNGKSLGVLSAVLKYGLLDGRGDDTRVSDLAVSIIAHPPGSPQRLDALKEAAAKPELFIELDGRFQGGKASDQAVRSYLLTQKFIPSAADAVIRSYRETKSLVESESGGYTSGMSAKEKTTVATPALLPWDGNHPSSVTSPSNRMFPQDLGEDIKISVSETCVIVSARLETQEKVDELVRMLGYAKMMLSPRAAPKANDPPLSSN